MTIILKTKPNIREPRGRVSSGQTVKGWSEAQVKREVELQIAPLLEEIEALRVIARRYAFISSHWQKCNFKFKKMGNALKSMVLMIDVDHLSFSSKEIDEAIDAAMGGN